MGGAPPLSICSWKAGSTAAARAPNCCASEVHQQLGSVCQCLPAVNPTQLAVDCIRRVVQWSLERSWTPKSSCCEPRLVSVAVIPAGDESTLDQLSGMISLCSGPMACGGKVCVGCVAWQGPVWPPRWRAVHVKLFRC